MSGGEMSGKKKAVLALGVIASPITVALAVVSSVITIPLLPFIIMAAILSSLIRKDTGIQQVQGKSDESKHPEQRRNSISRKVRSKSIATSGVSETKDNGITKRDSQSASNQDTQTRGMISQSQIAQNQGAIATTTTSRIGVVNTINAITSTHIQRFVNLLLLNFIFAQKSARTNVPRTQQTPGIGSVAPLLAIEQTRNMQMNDITANTTAAKNNVNVVEEAQKNNLRPKDVRVQSTEKDYNANEAINKTTVHAMSPVSQTTSNAATDTTSEQQSNLTTNNNPSTTTIEHITQTEVPVPDTAAASIAMDTPHNQERSGTATSASTASNEDEKAAATDATATSVNIDTANQSEHSDTETSVTEKTSDKHGISAVQTSIPIEPAQQSVATPSEHKEELHAEHSTQEGVVSEDVQEHGNTSDVGVVAAKATAATDKSPMYVATDESPAHHATIEICETTDKTSADVATTTTHSAAPVINCHDSTHSYLETSIDGSTDAQSISPKQQINITQGHTSPAPVAVNSSHSSDTTESKKVAHKTEIPVAVDKTRSITGDKKSSDEVQEAPPSGPNDKRIQYLRSEISRLNNNKDLLENHKRGTRFADLKPHKKIKEFTSKIHEHETEISERKAAYNQVAESTKAIEEAKQQISELNQDKPTKSKKSGKNQDGGLNKALKDAEKALKTLNDKLTETSKSNKKSDTLVEKTTTLKKETGKLSAELNKLQPNTALSSTSTSTVVQRHVTFQQ